MSSVHHHLHALRFSLATVERSIANLREKRDATTAQLAQAQATLAQSYDTLAAVGEQLAASEATSRRLDTALSPSLARAYMAARRLPDGAEEVEGDCA